MTERPDVVIVGSGAGGAASAWALTRAGLNVLLLEAGPRFDPARDYPQTNPDWERRGTPTFTNSQANILYGDLGALRPADTDLASYDAVTPRTPPAAYRTAERGGYSHVQGFGGSTLHYVGEAHRLHPESFRLHTDHGVGADWPLTYNDLDPYYQRVEALVGVAGPSVPGGRPRSASLPLPAHPLSPAAEVLSRAGARIGLTFEANTRAALSQTYDERPACNYCAQCSRGCPIGDKGSADVTFLRHAERTGRLQVMTNAQATRNELATNGAAAAIHYVQDGTAYRQETPILIIAGGAVQTPRLLLASAQADAPEGVANGSGQLGRNFMETLSWSSTGLLEGLQNSHMGLPADAISWSENAPGAIPGIVGGCRYTSSVQELGYTGPISYAQRLVPGHGADFMRRIKEAFGSAVTAAATGAVLTDERSKVSLSPDQTDVLGVPLPVISSVLTDNSIQLLHHMRQRCRALLTEAGVDIPLAEGGSWDLFQATHVFGTARMGDDPTSSVTNTYGRSHDHPNLYIADASVFPSSGGGESPSLTISALALRQADHIA